MQNKIIVMLLCMAVCLINNAGAENQGIIYGPVYNKIAVSINEKLEVVNNVSISSIAIPGSYVYQHPTEIETEQYNYRVNAISSAFLRKKYKYDAVTQTDLNNLRSRVLVLLGTLIDGSKIDTSKDTDADVFPSIRINPYTVFDTNLNKDVYLDHGFTKVEARYTSRNKIIYSNNFSDVPIFQIHLLELIDTINKMNAVKTSDRMQAYLVGYASCTEDIGGLETPEDMKERVNQDWTRWWNEGYSWQDDNLRENPVNPYYNSSGYETGLMESEFYAFLEWNWQGGKDIWVYDIQIYRKRLCFEVLFPQSDKCSDGILYLKGTNNAYSSWFYYDGDGITPSKWSNFGSARNPIYVGNVMEPVFPPVDPTPPDNTFRYLHEGLAAGVVVFNYNFQAVPLSDLDPLPDIADDGIVLGCSCSTCLPKDNAELRKTLRCPTSTVPLTRSGSNGDPISVSAYLTNYTVGPLQCQMYNLNSRILGSGSGYDEYVENGTTVQNIYRFAQIKRPSGAEPIFSFKDQAVGTPVIDLGYKLYDRDGAYVLDFPDEKKINHKFGGSGKIVEVSKLEDGIRVTLSGDGAEGWPYLVNNYTEDGLLSRVNGVTWDAFTSYPVYPPVPPDPGSDGYLVSDATYKDKNGNEICRITCRTACDGNGTSNMSFPPNRASLQNSTLNETGTSTTTITTYVGGTATAITRIGNNSEAGISILQKLDPANGDVIYQTTRTDGFDKNGNPTLTTTVSGQGRSVTNIDTMKVFSWGTEILATVSAAGTAEEQTVVKDFYADKENDGTNYSRLKQVVNPDGYWIRYSYDAQGRTAQEITPFANATADASENQWRSTIYDYTPIDSGDELQPNDSRPRTVIRKVLGTEISRSYNIYLAGQTITVQCASSDAAWNAAGNLVTTSESYTIGTFKGRPRKITRPDGTMTVYSYSLDGGILTSTTDSGVGSGYTVTDGTRSVTATNAAGNTLSSSTVDIASGITLSSAAYTLDGIGRATRVDYSDGTHTETIYGCCGPETEKDREGVVSVTGYDAMDRVSFTTKAGITTLYSYDIPGNIVATTRKGTDNSEITSTSTYNAVGELVSTSDPMLHETSYSRNYSARTRTMVNPDGTKVVTVNNIDGSTASTSGNSVHGVSYEYGIENGQLYTKSYPTEIPSQWTKSFTDFLGRNYKTVFADGTQGITYYDCLGRAVKHVSTSGKTMLTGYNAKGEVAKSAIDMNGNGVIDDGTDKVTTYSNTVTGNVRRQTVTVNAVATSVSDVSLNGFNSSQTSFGRISSSSTVLNGNGQKTVTVTNPDGSTVTQTYQNGLLVTSVHSVLGTTTYSYDPHARLSSQQTTINGQLSTLSYAYNANDQITQNTENGRITGFTYDSMGRRTAVSLPGNRTVNYTFAPTGEMTSVSGADTYPVSYTYDALGRMKTLTDGNSSTTTWNYDSQRGFMTSKIYANGQGVSYSYNPDGQPVTRIWARGIATTYAYNVAGDLTGVSYSGNTAPTISFIRDRFGRPTSITDGTGSRTLSYNDDSSLSSETIPYISGNSVVYSYDNLGRKTSMNLQNGGAALAATSYSYDSMSRLSSVSGGSSLVTASYSRVPGSSLLSSTSISNGSSNILTVNRSYDSLNRLTSISSLVPNAPVPFASSSYVYNNSDKRSNATLADGSYWEYTYDNLGQVTSGKKYDSTGAQIPNQQFGYAFDSIGNRQSENRNGHAFSYTPNNVNQYIQRTVPGAINISGVAETSAKVTIQKTSLGNTATAFSKLPDRTSKYFSKEYVFDNSSNPVSEAFKIFAVSFDQTQNKDIISKQQVDVFISKTPELYTYDQDGNLLTDGRFTYTWDAENRLIGIGSNSGNIPEASRVKLAFSYDYMSRRVSKAVYHWNAAISNWQLATSDKFAWDGWNLIASFDVSNNMKHSYTWGESGLISDTDASSSSTYFPLYDGNMNVMGYLDSTGAKVAEYEYDAFGRCIVKAGIKADDFNIRFSSYFFDKETGLVYYGYRYLNPDTGRWVNRDRIGETGGVNLYGTRNDFVNKMDLLGLALYAFDGTNNTPSDNTNISLTYNDGYTKPNSVYSAGVGNAAENTFFTRFFGLTTGWGMEAKSSAMLKALAFNIMENKDADVDIIGFSRGAVTAVMFAEAIQILKDKNISPYCAIEKIRFMGLYDPVRGPSLGAQPQIPSMAKNVSIAYSLDEKRLEFQPIMLSGNHMAFRGGHADIGGGYYDRGLANIALEWMINQGIAAEAPFKYPSTAGLSSLLVRHQETGVEFTYGLTYGDRGNLGGVPNHPSVSMLFETESANISFLGVDLSTIHYAIRRTVDEHTTEGRVNYLPGTNWF